MPHMVALVRFANRALDRDGDLELAKSALADARSIAEVARSAGMLDETRLAGHAADALDSLPSSIQAAVLAVLRDAVDRGVGAVLQWKPGAAVELQVWEATDGDAGHVGMLLVTPPGRTLAESAG